jgi:hypothetical protein
MAGSVLDLMTKPEVIMKAKEEHKKRLAGKSYEPGEERIPPLKLARETASKLKGKT